MTVQYMVSDRSTELEEIEMSLLLEGIFRYYGFDFRQYAFASLRRRIWNAIRDEKLISISAFQDKVLHDPACMERLLIALSVSVTAMFRDPTFYISFRNKVVPMLRTYPFIRIWHAGCATGEEVYSMAILLEEEGLYDRCRIYATDINETALRTAKDGIYPLELMQVYTGNYLKAGGKRSFSEYYLADANNAIFRHALKKNVVFSPHNLVTDGSFNEFNVILCRNVMIYFNTTLQEQVHKLLYESLIRWGFLCLGRKETLKYTPFEQHYEPIDRDERIYRRIV